MLRDDIRDRLVTDLIGPYADDEILHDYPSDIYLTGILYPQRSSVSGEQDEDLGAEGASGGGEGEDTSRDEVGSNKRQRPSSFGVSFALAVTTGAPRVNLDLSGARYVADDSSNQGEETQEALEKVDEQGEEDAESSPKRLWRRLPVELHVKAFEIREGSWDIPQDEHGVDDVRIHVTCAPWDDAWLVTVTILNAAVHEKGMGRPETEELNFFQTHLTVTCATGETAFRPRPLGWSAADEDTRSARLVYRMAHEYAVGHTSSADWTTNEEGHAIAVETNWLPGTIVPAVSAEGDKCFEISDTDEDHFSTDWLAVQSGEVLIAGLSKLPDAYKGWLDEQAARIGSLPAELQEQARLHLDRAEFATERMRDSISAIQENADVESAFRLANRAIQVQAQWGRPGEPPLRWRPFQLGFILLSLSSLANRDHADRGIADLLWFPTGGGKTEAYLALIAFVIILRRIRYGDEGAGVASIMRYTLRLLTIQQFQRASALICACEKIRLGEFVPDGVDVSLGEHRFSIGLWVGEPSTPNSIVEAVKSLQQGLASTPKQLTKCPEHREKDLIWEKRNDPDRIIARCSDPACIWGGENGSLPVWTVDDDVYRVRPSLLIGTIDKFAQVVRNSNTISLFGSDGKTQPPDLVIQDELHLISGPLGTIAGLYECAIDELCSRGGHKPKIIASTATIREARAQIKALFDRETGLFPPPIIDYDNSGFAVVDPDAPGRLYVGLTTAGRSAKYSLQAASASLIQSATIAFSTGQNEADWYTTLVAYFNSLRELGGALVLMQDDVDRTVKQLNDYRAETPRDYLEVTELTSRVSSSDVRGILDKLEVAYGKDGFIDVLLASNMISVGVDISRLGLMVVNGQPKTMSEYIQSTSRVGRGKVPGIVVTLFNDAKARDRSRFETFRTWHSTIYRDVEATSVTPFSSRARDKALHAALVGMARHLYTAMKDNPKLSATHRTQVEVFASLINQRADSVDPEEAAAVDTELTDIMNNWEARTGLRAYWNDYQINTSLLMSAEEAAKRRAMGRAPGLAIPTPNSMRNVEPSTVFILLENLSDRS